MIKAIFFDMDGTLVSHTTNSIPRSTIQAISRCKKQGIRVFLATGRHISEIKNFPVHLLHLDGYITLNGQYCFNDKEVYYELPLHKEDIQAILDINNEKPFPLVFVEEKKMYINFNNELEARVQKDINTPLHKPEPLDNVLNNKIYQMIAYGLTQEQSLKLTQSMPHSRQTSWYDEACDIIPKIGGKKNGILQTLNYYKIKPEETMAFGDGENDIDMFDVCHLSIAMGNASDFVKSHATDVTDSVDEDGIYNALIKHHILK